MFGVPGPLETSHIYIGVARGLAYVSERCKLAKNGARAIDLPSPDLKSSGQDCEQIEHNSAKLRTTNASRRRLVRHIFVERANRGNPRFSLKAHHSSLILRFSPLTHTTMPATPVTHRFASPVPMNTPSKKVRRCLRVVLYNLGSTSFRRRLPHSLLSH